MKYDIKKLRKQIYTFLYQLIKPIDIDDNPIPPNDPAVYNPIISDNGIKPVGGSDKLNINGIPRKKPSNENYSSFVKKTLDIIRECDRTAAESSDNTVKSLNNDFANKLIENLILSGLTAINPSEGAQFDNACHTTRPFSIVREGVIDSTVRLGIRRNDEILIKAIVTIK